MTKATNTRLIRTHEVENGKITKPRDKVLAPIFGSPGDCFVCKTPVIASNGQVLSYAVNREGKHLYSHKRCRK